MSVSDGAVTALLRAELGRLTPPQDTIAAIGDLAYHDAAMQVKLAIEAVLGGDVDETAVRALTAILSGAGGAPGGSPWTCGGCGTRYPGTVSPAPGGRCAECQALAQQNVIDNAGHAVSACTGPGWCTCGGHVDKGGTFHPAGSAA